ncbi:MAG: hypothetical protein ACK5DJ_10210, partial [Bacteroidota bacterium]
MKRTRNRATTANTGLAKVAVHCSADSFVVPQSLVHRINICGKNRQLLLAANCYQPQNHPIAPQQYPSNEP